MSRPTWTKLSSDDRKAVKDAAQEASVLQRKLSAEVEDKILDEYKKAGTVQISTPNPAPFKRPRRRLRDSWELKGFGAFVKKLRAASN